MLEICVQEEDVDLSAYLQLWMHLNLNFFKKFWTYLWTD